MRKLPLFVLILALVFVCMGLFSSSVSALSCDTSCSIDNDQCDDLLVCTFVDMWAGYRCRNPECYENRDCACPTPTPTLTPTSTLTPQPDCESPDQCVDRYTCDYLGGYQVSGECGIPDPDVFCCHVPEPTPTPDTTKLFFIHSDHLGSNTLISDEEGNLKTQQTYYPYGTTRTISENPQKPTERAYTSQVSDQDQTGLYYYNARYYDPLASLFTQPDINQGLNRYVYASNNPLKFFDPQGKRPECSDGYDQSCWDDRRVKKIADPEVPVNDVEVVQEEAQSRSGRSSRAARKPRTVNVYEYFTGGSGEPVQLTGASSEVLRLEETDSGFIYHKNNEYEQFLVRDGMIYHFKDTTWATGNCNDVMCQGEYSGKTASLNFAQGMNEWWDPASLGMPWVPFKMEMGQEFISWGDTYGTVEDGSEFTNQICQTASSGPGKHGIRLVYQGAYTFENGAYYSDIIILEITGTFGRGERFYYSRNHGWIGFERAGGEDFAYPVHGE